MPRRPPLIALATALAAVLSGCETETVRIPAVPVHIPLDNAGVWAIYGVHGWGQYQQFILKERKPANYPYTATTYTGFGGVLLIYGMDPFTGDLGPLAYDLSCPVERQPDIRVEVFFDQGGEFADGLAICPDCGSIYNLTSFGGASIEGEAKQKKYNLQRYECYPNYLAGSASVAGYTIERR